MLKHILTAAVATGALLAGSAAFAQDYDHDRNQSQHYSDRNNHREHDGDRNESRGQNWSGRGNRNQDYAGGGSYRNRDYNRSYNQRDYGGGSYRNHDYNRSYYQGGDNNSGYYHHRDYDRDGGYYRDRGYRSGYYGYRNYVDRDRIFYVIREHNYNYVGDPYWYGDDYVVRAYDPYGRLVLVRVDPYTGAWLGVMFRL